MTNTITVITGGGGVLGGAVALQLASNANQKIYLFDKEYRSQRESTEIKDHGKIFWGDVNNRKDLENLRNLILSENKEIQKFNIVNCFFEPEIVLYTEDHEIMKIDTNVDRPGKSRNLAILKKYAEYPDQHFNNHLNTEIVGLHKIITTFLPLILNAESSSIVNLSSQYGIKPPNQDLLTYLGRLVYKAPGYPVAKAGVISFSEYLATLFAGTNVRVNCVAPGVVDRGQSGDFKSRYFARSVLHKLCTPDEVAGAVEFLLSSKASHITGVTIPIDGGWTIN